MSAQVIWSSMDSSAHARWEHITLTILALHVNRTVNGVTLMDVSNAKLGFTSPMDLVSHVLLIVGHAQPLQTAPNVNRSSSSNKHHINASLWDSIGLMSLSIKQRLCALLDALNVMEMEVVLYAQKDIHIPTIMNAFHVKASVKLAILMSLNHVSLAILGTILMD